MMQILFLFSMIFQTSSSVHVLVADATGKPLADVRVELVLYAFESNSGQMQARKTFSDHCATDQNGECTIVIGETRGILRGRLDLGKYGGRDVIWLGGALEAPVMIDLEKSRVKGTEAGPYDFQEKDGGVPIRQTPWLAIMIVSALVGSAVFWAYVQSRKEHA